MYSAILSVVTPLLQILSYLNNLTNSTSCLEGNVVAKGCSYYSTQVNKLLPSLRDIA